MLLLLLLQFIGLVLRLLSFLMRLAGLLLPDAISPTNGWSFSSAWYSL